MTEEPSGDPQIAALLRETRDIKRLIVFSMLKDGLSQTELAQALGISQSSVSRMFDEPVKPRSRSASTGSG